jgi:hypothetical protein
MITLAIQIEVSRDSFHIWVGRRGLHVMWSYPSLSIALDRLDD